MYENKVKTIVTELKDSEEKKNQENEGLRGMDNSLHETIL
jgi:hypothetical protein